MKPKLETHINNIKPYIPLLLLLGYFFYRSLSFPLHDFANSYFPAHLLLNNEAPESILFDIYEFNNYIWNLGYTEVLADFYINSPFNTVAFYPLAYFEDAYVAKAIFNIFSIIFFVFSIAALFRRYGKKSTLFLYSIPILFFIPLRNQILFGQTYFLVFALIVFSFLLIEKQKNATGGFLLALASIIKVFPVFYGVSLVFNKNKKGFIYAFFGGLILLCFGVIITGTPIWKTYFLEVLPNTIANKSTVNFQYNAQSLEVFFKTLFVQDSYYNPNAFYNSESLYLIAKWITKSLILGLAVSISFKIRKHILALLSIWIVTLFLVQARTATYAQILWIIPAFYVFNSKMNRAKKIGFFFILFLMCNLPISKLEDLPVLFRFSRIWLTLILATLLFSSKVKYKPFLFIGALLILLFPLHLNLFSTTEKDTSEYVLDKQEHFMIYDFSKTENVLAYSAIGRLGKETIKTQMPIYKFDEVSCTLENNQIVLNGKQITNDPSLKKKPILINNKEVYYLTDSKSRRGAFTLKKINLSK